MAIAPIHPIPLESGTTITINYNEIGRIKSQSTSNGETVSYIYNDDGRVETVTNSSGTTTYSYDPIGNLRGIESPNGSSIRYKHDGFGRVIEIGEKATATSPEAITKYHYDAGGNLIRVIAPNQQETVMVYDAVSRLESRTLPNGVTTTYVYQDQTDWIESITHTATNSTVLSSLTYEREPGGEPTKITREDGSYRTFVYDKSLRLEQEAFYDAAGTLQETIAYTYDADGKRLAHSDNDGDHTYTYGDGFQLENISNGTNTESYSHDEDGRLESITRDGETLNLDHNATDKLTLITNATTGESVTYFYDAEGNRIGEQSGSEVTQYLVAPSMGSGLSVQDLVTDGSGNVLANHVYVGNRPLMRLDENNNAVYYLTDAMGSVMGLVDENGEMVAAFDYDGFGNVRTTVGEDIVGDAIGGDYRFQSQWLESESGLYYFRARDYDAHTGQFLSRDPVDIIETAPESFNPYQFVYNNPLIYSDPTGEFTITELNASQKIQGQLSNIQRYSGHKAKEYLVERLGDGISEIVASTFNYFLPTGGGFGDDIINLVLSGSEEASELFEFGITSLFCEHFEGLPLASSILLYPGIEENGKPRSRGINCAGEDGHNHRTRRAANRHSRGLKRPEFIFMSGKFDERNPNSYLVGDVKIIQHAAYKSVTDSSNRAHSQWKAMANYARGWQALPFVSYVSFFESGFGHPGVSKSMRQKMAKEASKKGVILVMANLID